MISEVKNLTELRRQEQSIHGYSNSSHWYTGLSNAIRFIERAKKNDDPLNQFADAWSTGYNLFMMYGKVGDEEFKRFSKWVTDVKDVSRVRRLFDTTLNLIPLATFYDNMQKTKNILLKPQGKLELNVWLKAEKLPDKLCQYFFTMVRDIRNTCFHPNFNPNSAATKRALIATNDCLIPVIIEATKTIIENPVKGTTGKTTTYRSFLYPFLRNSDSFFSDYYLERLFPDEELKVFPENEIKPILKSFAKQMKENRKKLALGSLADFINNWCEPIIFRILKLTAKSGIHIVTSEYSFQPTFVLHKNDSKEIHRKEYHSKDASRDLACLIWIINWDDSMDMIGSDSEYPHLSITEVAHRAMTASDIKWAIVTNGRKVRLLSNDTSHKPRCFLSIDLESIADNFNDEDALLSFRYLLGCFSGSSFIKLDEDNHTLLDRVAFGSERHGKEIGEELKQNVFNALESLGDGFLHYFRSNKDKLESLRSNKAPSTPSDTFLKSKILLNEVYQESLSLMYRLLFLFYAESRNMLPMEDEMYREAYSLESIRDDIISIHDDPDPKRFFGKGDTNLWDRLKELFEFVNEGWRKVIPVYNGGLFNPDFHEFLERFKIPDFYLAQAIDYLSRTQPQTSQFRGEGRKKLTYRDLDVRHLGNIYEGILEYSAHIAKENLVILTRSTGPKAYQEYVPTSKLKPKEKEQLKVWEVAIKENRDNPKLPRGCKVSGKKEKGQYFLVYGGRKSKRKSSGSYYTPDYIVQYIVENSLGPIVRGETKTDFQTKKEENPLSSNEILQLKILDPAMGSGHFLIAATEYLARAYGEALAREGKIKGLSDAESEYTRHKRIIAERCIYGVDLNPMAVELAKLSMWLFTMDIERPLSFLNHHLKCGNSLIGGWIDYLGQEPGYNDGGRQMNLFELSLKKELPMIIRDVLEITRKETLSYEDIKSKRSLDLALKNLKAPYKNIADAWVSLMYGEKQINYTSLLTNISKAIGAKFEIAKNLKSFHWELEFPEVWYAQSGKKLKNGGFDAVIGNPPYDVLEKERKGDEKPHAKLLKFIKGNHFYLECLGGKINLYRPFLLLSVKILKLGGICSKIIPMSFMGDSSLTNFRKSILETRKINWIEAFPQKDNANNRVFKEAKLSTCIVNICNEKPIEGQKFIIRVYPGKSFDEIPMKSKISYGDIKLLDSKVCPIPIAKQEEIDMAIKIHQKSHTLKDVAEINRGEINQTIYRKYITSNPKHKHLLKGVEINLFGFNENLSQGEKEYFNEILFEKEGQYKRPVQVRVATQRITGVDEIRRLICTISDNGAYFADSTNSIHVEDINMMKFVLGLLNSNILNWRFSITSTNNNVSTTELEALPIPSNIEPQLFKKVVKIVDTLMSKRRNKSFELLNSHEFNDLNNAFYEYYRLTKSEISIFNNRKS